MKTVAVILVILLVVVAAILILAAMKPATFRVVRATTVKAPPEKIFPLIADFRAWSAWSPWEKKDPALKRTYGGPASGQGAVYEWEGNSKVGKECTISSRRIGGSAFTAPSYIGNTCAPDRVNKVSTPWARPTATAS